jgi:hypothetical protein
VQGRRRLFRPCTGLFTPSAPLSDDGTHTVQIRGTDTVGNAGAWRLEPSG